MNGYKEPGVEVAPPTTAIGAMPEQDDATPEVRYSRSAESHAVETKQPKSLLVSDAKQLHAVADGVVLGFHPCRPWLLVVCKNFQDAKVVDYESDCTVFRLKAAPLDPSGRPTEIVANALFHPTQDTIAMLCYPWRIVIFSYFRRRVCRAWQIDTKGHCHEATLSAFQLFLLRMDVDRRVLRDSVGVGLANWCKTVPAQLWHDQCRRC